VPVRETFADLGPDIVVFVYDQDCFGRHAVSHRFEPGDVTLCESRVVRVTIQASYRDAGESVKTLWLLRHAKASPGGAGLADRDRPLTGRGRDAAARMGRHLSEREVHPELVLCSTALRTRETIELVAKELDTSLEIEFEDELYLASERDLRERIERVSDDVRSIMLVGHNPGLEELAIQLAVRGHPGALADLRRKVPTGALAELRIHSQRWSHFARGCELVAFVTPKQLAA
jgi:phosphohistidine phosphatase